MVLLPRGDFFLWLDWGFGAIKASIEACAPLRHADFILACYATFLTSINIF